MRRSSGMVQKSFHSCIAADTSGESAIHFIDGRDAVDIEFRYKNW